VNPGVVESAVQSEVAYIGLGANLGEPRQAVLDAMDAIASLPGTRLAQRSRLYGSAPVDAGGGDYVNAVVQVHTTLTPHALLQALHGIEQSAGRARPYRNAPRTLDLDLLLYGTQHIHDTALTVPHPRMGERAFVLRPLADLTPDLVGAAQLQAVADQAIWPL
jgi:2-amino-4-hydroxy-6-hydroxymethyldihydropteridine diphosphokinase